MSRAAIVTGGIGCAIAFLPSPKADYITGQVLSVGDGLTMAG
jgi:NAD(P)-dependent dehydrogenase (short-subunit alcohol dehydrogenase family)